MATVGKNHVLVMSDGTRIPYRLDGNPDPNAPLIILSNPSLVDLSIWDDMLVPFFAQPDNQQYRTLRYDNRGRSKHNGKTALNIDILTGDILALLHVVKVTKAAAMTGISLGGMVALALAIHHPERVATIMPCDFFPTSPPENGSIWGARVEMARKDPKAPVGPDGARILGVEVPEVMVQRWLSPKSLNGGVPASKIVALKKMAHDNPLDGLASIVDCITSFDLLPDIDQAVVPAMFVAGRDDTPVLPAMKHLAESYGEGVELRLIDDAGHIPIFDRPEEFARILTEFLKANSGAIG